MHFIYYILETVLTQVKIQLKSYLILFNFSQLHLNINLTEYITVHWAFNWTQNYSTQLNIYFFTVNFLEKFILLLSKSEKP